MTKKPLRGYTDFSKVVSFAEGGFSITKRTQICFPRQLLLFRAKSAESQVDELQNFRAVPSAVLTSEKEEAKAFLTLFLKNQGLSSAVAARTINKSDHFIDHLVSRLHSVHKTWYLVGRELTTLEIRDALTPYLESLLEEHGNILVDVVENFPNPPHTKKIKAVARVSEVGPSGQLPPHILYLIELGMDVDQIKAMTRKFPTFAYYSLEGKIKPIVEFLLDLGIPQSGIPTILHKRPQLCGISLSENILPTMSYLEKLGLDKKQWAKVIHRFPALLTYSRQKVRGTVDYMYELGLSADSIGKILTRCPTL
ncbi:hypothetical protein MKX01_033964 [Papaver californicum]|nr:hypothetical protein MKX01_033964 [Papaver californicum]